MMSLLAFALGLLVGALAVAIRMRGDLTWPEVALVLRGKPLPKETQGGGGGPKEPL
jgi:hypothetical protein